MSDWLLPLVGILIGLVVLIGVGLLIFKRWVNKG
jgi:hypothetical protein